ncbi:hypothetical protein TNCV_3162881 [Trichonephila clavipes]|nr:hypothetical protein TNCV_3162881 [Trichonephila clavipes]
MAIQIRKDIVCHVCNEWKSFKCLTQGPSGAPYCTKRWYNTEISKPYTYGSICEIMVAGEIFPYKFQVYQDGNLIAVFGDALQGIRRLWFTGNFNEGRFDALVPLDEAIHGYNYKSDVCNSDESTPSIQSKRGTKRRKRFTSSIRYKQVRKAVLKCTQSHPEVHRDAVRKYTQSHPEVNRDAVRKYTQCHLEVNRVAVRKYTQKHPEVNRVAVRKYTQKHPEVNRKEVKNYVSKNSHVARTKNNKYKEKISEIRLLPWTSKHLSAFK